LNSTFFPLIELYNRARVSEVASIVRYFNYNLDIPITVKRHSTYSLDIAIAAKRHFNDFLDVAINGKRHFGYTQL
jgi:hypothetical protein